MGVYREANVTGPSRFLLQKTGKLAMAMPGVVVGGVGVASLCHCIHESGLREGLRAQCHPKQTGRS